MPTYPDFQKASFNGTEFPYSQVTIKGGIRHHVHEYPHSPGGDIEKMGRKLYSFRFRVPFHDLPGSKLDQLFPNLFPGRLQTLIRDFDQQFSAALVVPSIGTIQCVATDWDGTGEMADAISGETWNIEFLEDVDQDSLFDSSPALGIHAMGAAAETLQTKAEEHEFEPGVFQAINDAVGSVLGVLGEADQYSRLVAGKIEAVANLCGTADRELSELQDPMNHVVLEALKDLWANAVDLSQNIPGTGGGPISTYRVPKLMSVGQVASALYGRADRGFDIMQINAIDDPFAIPAGTTLKYVKAA